MNVQSSVSIEIIVPTINNLSEICVQKQNINKNKNKLVQVFARHGHQIAPRKIKIISARYRWASRNQRLDSRDVSLQSVDHSGSLQVVACPYECLYKMSPKSMELQRGRKLNKTRTHFDGRLHESIDITIQGKANNHN